MTIQRKTLEAAAFWDQAACLDCGHTQTMDAEDDEPGCEACGSERVYEAAWILGILDSVEVEE